VGGVLYGIEKGVEVAFDVGYEQDKKYHDKRNEEEGTHEMDSREVQYKIHELAQAKAYYEDQVKFHNFGEGEESQKQHAQDVAMLQSINKNLDALRNQRDTGEPVYSVVGEGFDVDALSKEDKQEYDRLVQRVDNAKDRAYYKGGDPAKIDLQQARLDEFIGQHSDALVANQFVNKATDEELEQITQDYIENGGDIFETLDQDMLDVLGISEAIATDDVQTQRIQQEEGEKNIQTTDDVAASAGLYVPSAQESGQM